MPAAVKITISFPAELASHAEALARAEGVNGYGSFLTPTL